MARAITRKAHMKDSGRPSGDTNANLSIKKILGKSKKCRVRLNGGEVNSFKEFVANKI